MRNYTGIIRTISRRIIANVGYDRLNTSFHKYLCVYVCYMIASLLSTAYFNVFLLRATGSSEALARYNLLLACFQPIVMLAALSVLKHTSVNICQRVGLALHALAYLWLALSNESSESMVYIISGIFAAGNAFYYTSYTPQILAYTQDETRDTAYGAMGFMSTLGNLSLPHF